MKKYLAFILALVVMISCCGCVGGSGNEDVRGEVTEFSLGKTEGSTYRNVFLGLSCTVPAGWEFYTDAQMLEMNNLVGDVLDEEVAEQLKNASIVYDMMVINAYDGSSISVNLEKFNPIQILSMDVKATLEAQIDTIKTSYENMGYTNVNVEYQKVTVDGKAFDALVLTANMQGTSVNCTIFSFIKGSYMANVSLFSFTDNKAEELLGYFTVD